jgi:hypothetical protein
MLRASKRLRDDAIIYGGLIGRSWLLAALSARPINIAQIARLGQRLSGSMAARAWLRK